MRLVRELVDGRIYAPLAAAFCVRALRPSRAPNGQEEGFAPTVSPLGIGAIAVASVYVLPTCILAMAYVGFSVGVPLY